MAQIWIGIRPKVAQFSIGINTLALPADPTPSDVAPAVRDAHGKEIFISGDSIKSTFHVSRDDVAKTMTKEEIPVDMFTFFKALQKLGE